MKKSILHFLLMTGLIMLASFANKLEAQSTYESAQSGNYSDGTTWVGGNPPGDYQHILIKSGHTVTLDRGTDVNDYVYVWDVTIEEGAVLDNNGWPLWIRTSSASTPQYKNDGVHDGPGTMQVYQNGAMRIDGNGTTNVDVEYREQGALLVRYSSNLTINGDIKPTQYNYAGPTSTTQRITYEVFEGVGGTLTVNGDIYSAGNIVSNNPVKILVAAEGALHIDGNIYFNAAADVVENNGVFTLTGDLKLGSTSSSYFINWNNGQAEIGGDVLGTTGPNCWFRIAGSSYTKLGGQVFPNGNGKFAILTSTVAQVIEYNGTADQTIPSSTAYKNLVVSNSNATATIQSNVTVATGTALTIKPGAALSHTSGTFNVSGTFTIESDATGTGSFISNNTYNGNIERYIAGHNNAGPAAGWHLLSSPVANQAISAFHTPALGGDDFFKWSDADGLWINRTTEAGTLNPGFEANFASGAGYLVSYENTGTKSFSGSINSSNVAVSGLTADNGGWHLLGNPFSSAILWNDGNWTLNNVDGIAQVWNEANASYSTVEANEAIPSMNGFFVRASQAGASITIPAAARVHSGQSWYKESQSTNRIVLKAIDHQNNTAQPTVIRYNEQATEGYDNAFDSYFLSGYAPQLYSLDGQNNQYALNTLPEFDPQQQIPLGFEKNQSDNFTLSLVENTVAQEVYLTDKHTQQTVNLSQGSYSFTASGNDLDRFSLHFALVGIDESITDKPALHVWYSNGQLHLNNIEQGELELYNVLGQSVLQTTVQATTHTSHQLSLKPGVYVVQLRSNTGAATAKINIQ